MSATAVEPAIASNPLEINGVELRGSPVPPRDLDVELFLKALADIARRSSVRLEGTDSDDR